MFERLPSGYRVTDAGDEVLELAQQMEASSNQLQARVLGRDQGARGLLRVTLPPRSQPTSLCRIFQSSHVDIRRSN